MNSQVMHIIETLSNDPTFDMLRADDETTRAVLRAMLCEQTPSNLVDSGRYYGYGWQANRKTEFESQSKAWLSEWTGPIISVYHYLADRLDFAPGLTDRLATLSAKSGVSYFEDAREFAYQLVSEPSSANIVNNTDEERTEPPFTWYSYNHENLLSSDIHITELDDLIILQIHNGCDARWGFTAPVVFWKNDRVMWGDLYLMHDMIEITVFCTECDSAWDFQDASRGACPDCGAKLDCYSKE
jgi:hypothetical protein